MATASLKNTLVTTVATKSYPTIGTELGTEGTLSGYLRQRMITEDRPAKVVKEKLPDKSIVSLWNTIPKGPSAEHDMLELLEQALSGTQASNLTTATKKAIDVAVTARSSSEAGYGKQVAERLSGHFDEEVKKVWHAEEIKDLSIINVRDTLLELFGDELETFPRVGTYTKAAKAHYHKRLGIPDHAILAPGSNEMAHHFMVPGIVKGKSVEIAKDWYKFTADNCSLGREANERFEGLTATQANNIAAPAKYTAIRDATDGSGGKIKIANMLSVAKRERDRIQTLFTKACHLEQSLNYIWKDMKKEVWVRIGTGPRPIHMGPRVHEPKTNEYMPVVGVDYSIESFLKFDMFTAIKNGGTLKDILDTVKAPETNATSGVEPVASADEWLTQVLRLGEWSKRKTFVVDILPKLAGEYGSAGSTLRMAIKRVYDACQELWPNISALVEADYEQYLSDQSKEAANKLASKREAQKAGESAGKIETVADHKAA